MTRLRGWAPKGERLIDKVPQGRRKTATFLAALRQDRINAPCLFDGPINGERLRAYVEQFLVPTLKPGDVVILNNLGSHKGKAVRRAIRDVGARRCWLNAPAESAVLNREPGRTGHLFNRNRFRPVGESAVLNCCVVAAVKHISAAQIVAAQDGAAALDHDFERRHIIGGGGRVRGGLTQLAQSRGSDIDKSTP